MTDQNAAKPKQYTLSQGVGRPMKYRDFLDILEEDAIYLPATIVDHGIKHGLVELFQDLEQAKKNRLKIRHTLARFAKNHGFPEEGDGSIKMPGQTSMPGWFGWRWQAAITDRYNRSPSISKIENEPNLKVDLKVRMTELAYAIPAIRNKFSRLEASFENGDTITTFAEGYGTASNGERLCISFLLGVWSGGFPWVENEGDELGFWSREYGIRRFDLIDAVVILSQNNLQPILAWAAKPFWP